MTELPDRGRRAPVRRHALIVTVLAAASMSSCGGESSTQHQPATARTAGVVTAVTPNELGWTEVDVSVPLPPSDRRFLDAASLGIRSIDHALGPLRDEAGVLPRKYAGEVRVHLVDAAATSRWVTFHYSVTSIALMNRSPGTTADVLGPANIGTYGSEDAAGSRTYVVFWSPRGGR